MGSISIDSDQGFWPTANEGEAGGGGGTDGERDSAVTNAGRCRNGRSSPAALAAEERRYAQLGTAPDSRRGALITVAP